jgi:hypothetical protein
MQGLGKPACRISLTQNEHAQQIANHDSPRTTKLYDRTSDVISLDEVGWILIWDFESLILLGPPIDARCSHHGTGRVPDGQFPHNP